MAGVIRDPFGRSLDYVRISVTDRCNFRCRYCMPAEGVAWIPHERIMTYEDILFLCEVLTGLGVRRVRFTGGEPFVRKGFVPFLAEVRNRFPHLAMAVTTNGSFLEAWADRLPALGLDSVNVSLDTLDPSKFTAMTAMGGIDQVLRGIDAVLAAGSVPVKLNTVVVRSVNAAEIEDLVLFAGRKGVLLRFIEFMPLDGQVWSREEYVPAEEIRGRLPAPDAWLPDEAPTQGPNGPARYYVHERTGQRVGIISAVSDHFCGRCNRLRVTATGELRSCLFRDDSVPIMEALRMRDASALQALILAAAAAKPREGGTGLPKETDSPGYRHMSRIGG
ncbi:MAG TPA: GTP 3',8-cyclase MoaA [Synergistaceae bacterium]|nr:GTP 3',8-cyclase MoaA [Synergistaceae bacterium]